MDGDAAVTWAGINALLLGAIWRLSRRFFPDDTVAPMAIHTFVVYWAAVTVACFLLGGLHLISDWGVMAAGIVLTTLWFGVLQFAAVCRAKTNDSVKDSRLADNVDPKM